MTRPASVLRNTASLVGGKLASDFCSLLFLLLYGRTFGAEPLGQYAFAMALGGFASIFVSSGLTTLMEREVSRDATSRERWASHLLPFQLIAALIMWGVLIAIAELSALSTQAWEIVMLIGAYQVLLRIGMMYQAQFRAHEAMGFAAFLETFHRALILVIGSALLFLFRDPVWALAAYPFSAFAMVVAGWALSTHELGPVRPSFEWPVVRAALRKAWPFFSVLALAVAHDRVGIILLRGVDGEAAAGFYTAADRLIVTLTGALFLFRSATFPVFARLVAEPQTLERFFGSVVRCLVVVSVPASTLLYLYSEPLVVLLFGSRYASSAAALKILAPALLWIGVFYVSAGLLLALDRQRALLRVQTVGFVSLLSLAAFLIPRASFLGLAYAKLVVSILLASGAMLCLPKTFRAQNWERSLAVTVAACIAAIGIDSSLADWHWPLRLGAAAASCAAVLLLLQGLPWSDLRVMRDSESLGR